MFKIIADKLTPYIIRFINYILEILNSGLRTGKHFEESVNFFIYDTLKIIFLLSFMIFIISFIRSFFPPERVKNVLSRFSGIKSHIIASVLGVLSPF